MSQFYSNITLRGPESKAVAAYLSTLGDNTFVSPNVRDAVVIFHEDLGGQEILAAELSAHFACPALLIMGYGQAILLYHLYESGKQTDAYVSTPHEGLELDGPAPSGDATKLCAAFDAERFERRVKTVLSKLAKEGQPYAYAVNRHGDLLAALKLPTFAAGAGFGQIELGEMPAGPDFDPTALIRTPRGK